MDLLPDGSLPAVLAGLALLDGLSVGTLLIPLFLLIAPGRVRPGRILLYLATITAFYLLIGLLFLWGLVNVIDVAAEFFSSTPGSVLRLVVGAVMLVGSFLMPKSKKKEATPVAVSERADAAPTDALTPDASAARIPAEPASDSTAPRPGRLVRWRAKLLDPATPRYVVMGVAIAAGLVEAATMLPYIVAMTMLAETDLDAVTRVGALAGYCVIMILPALVLLVARLLLHRHIEKPLQRFTAWVGKDSADTAAWIVGILGFFIARAAAMDLGLPGFTS